MSGETASEIETPEAEADVPIASRRVVPPTSSAKSSKCGVFLDPEDTISIGKGFVNDLAAASTSDIRQRFKCRRDKMAIGIHYWTASFSLTGRTRGEK